MGTWYIHLRAMIVWLLPPHPVHPAGPLRLLLALHLLLWGSANVDPATTLPPAPPAPPGSLTPPGYGCCGTVTVNVSHAGK